MKKILIIIFIVLNIITMTSCSDSQKNNDNTEEDTMSLSEQQINSSNTKEDSMPLYVSIIQLIANPAEYHGKKVAVDGVANLEFEGTSVSLCIDNWYYMATKNALWLNFDSEIIDGELWYYINGERISEEDAQKYNGKYVLIEGTFDMNATGYRGGYSGGIKNITRFEDFSMSHRSTVIAPESTVEP